MIEIDWNKIKSDLKEEFQIEDWNDWQTDKRVSNFLDAFIEIRYLINKQLEK